jgi:hypothetical protein
MARYKHYDYGQTKLLQINYERQIQYMDRMKRKIDTDEGRHQYSRRTLRTRKKVNAQWLLFCLVHNIGKVQRYGSRVMTTKNRKRRKRA